MNRRTRVVAAGSGLKDRAWRSLAPPQPSEPLEPLEPFCCMRAASQLSGGGTKIRAGMAAAVGATARDSFNLLGLEVGGCGEVLKEEEQLRCCHCLKNGGGRTTDGMIGGSSPLAAVLTVVSVMCLSLLAVLCLRCKKKSNEEDYENAEYLHQVEQEENDSEPDYVNEIC
ncbi:hypothetical protein EYF80_027832 [Liparis tanakae]|uniref:Uncharacterized protein n=1 Tax=Liparis tanakae TaxID=230148 RepID=A0A4Z2H7U7_9TELE|nr:hypothetical protein EYF80_027832 [Liparis tanakae]